mmetsp:Transcript_61326/g.170016  ORF Transcript_61326/g.170016 Transcript_61326/m.170016 type:complete len:102 (+) Transcript_61326:411-716(+)
MGAISGGREIWGFPKHHDGCLTPRWAVKQTRYGQAFKATMHTAPWDPRTDSLIVHSGAGEYGSILGRWNFAPAVKMHSPDFKIVAFKPAGWLKSDKCPTSA